MGMEPEAFEELQQRLGYAFSDEALLARAVTHASAAGDVSESNERLEFLGDAVVGLAVSAHLFSAMPQAAEGEMTVIKSHVVSRQCLSAAGRELGLAEFLQVDEGLQRRADYPDSLLADAFEAVVGAIFLDGGMRSAGEFLLRALGPSVEEARAEPSAAGCKSIIQEKTQAAGQGAPRYVIVETIGPDHRRLFKAAILVQHLECGTGWGLTKKAAEQNAARAALDRLYPGWQDGDDGCRPAGRPSPADAEPRQ